MTEDREFPSSSKLDTTVPHSARIWNYWLGGKDHFAVDRAAGDEVIAHIPDIPIGAKAERAFLKRVVRFLVEDAGIRQFLDVGTGLPSADNTHEVAQSLDPHCRVVYIDNDPLVMAHARALLTSAPGGSCDYVEADLRQPDTILASARQTLDFSQPIGLMLLGVVNHLMDDDVAYGSVAQLVQAMPTGSYLVLTHSTAEIHGEPMLRVMRETTERGGTPIRARTKTELERFFDGLDLLEPGVVTCSRWRPDPESDEPEVYLFGGVGRIG
ncbi:SAM-dependent methyltransferase [Plantactinospora sp. KLBMP9567]|uniref:SAM-dependent methyltransferase n=1 Tax=Plantactinospora sp. KLBMP9567 TaxID=3085900 RepID=UPI0029810829|nr:SAM-dependent methyltransferase [Plantactinospora sp. KLBMP9567]MDW5330146.1 SAM-dependent methyltransferase [Plantactinospora sp. KLBMP9567]